MTWRAKKACKVLLLLYDGSKRLSCERRHFLVFGKIIIYSLSTGFEQTRDECTACQQTATSSFICLNNFLHSGPQPYSIIVALRETVLFLHVKTVCVISSPDYFYPFWSPTGCCLTLVFTFPSGWLLMHLRWQLTEELISELLDEIPLCCFVHLRWF